MLIDNGSNIELRIPLIPNITDTDSNINDIIQFILSLGGLPGVILLVYNPLNLDKLDRYCLDNPLTRLKIQPKNKLLEIKQRFIDRGINAAISE
jgi:pyruvate formate lyase activating enzyme